MNWVNLLSTMFEILKEVLPFLFVWRSAKKDSENEQLRENNEKLKKYNEISNDDISVDDVSRVWGKNK